MAKQSEDMDAVFHALADPTRRAVIGQLTAGAATVSELASPFAMALPSFVQHIRVLEESGLIRSKKVGRVRTCHLVPKVLSDVEAWVVERRLFWERRVDALQTYVEEGGKTKGENDGS